MARFLPWNRKHTINNTREINFHRETRETFLRSTCETSERELVALPAFDPEEYKRALEQGVVLSAYARVMFVGPGGVGKSSLLHGLMNKPLPEANSTQLAETITVKPATKKWASAGENSKSFWREITDNDEVMELVGLILLVAKVSAGHSKSSRFVSQKVAAFLSALDSAEIANGQQSTSTNVLSIQHTIISDILTQILELAKKHPNAQAPEKEVLILNWDCGGQSIFLDILPAFLTPRTMFLLFYDARRIASSCISRSFHNGKMIDFQEQQSTTLEMLLEWMASIHAMLVPITPKQAEQPIPKFPRIIPIGTHGDDKNINKEEIIRQLNEECEGKAFVPLLKRSVIVDNTTAGEGENEDPAFRSIRKEVYDFACKDLVVETPVAWVLFRRVFQKVVRELNSPIVSYQTVEEIATACNIPSTAISTMVQFYHDLAVFFHYNNVPSLQNNIIADPQWLINQFAKIMAPKGFAKLWKAPQFLDDEAWKGHELLWNKLWKSGILYQSLYEEVWRDCELSAQSLVDLLVHFLLAAPINKLASRVTNFYGKQYFISSILPTFKCRSNGQGVKHVTVKQTAPLQLIFNTFYVPPGFFCRLVSALLSKSHFQVDFNEGVYQDRIVMLYGELNHEIDEIVLEKHKNSVQIEIIRTRDRPQGGAPFSVICQNVLNIINKCFPKILHWLKGIQIDYAFTCEHCRKCEQPDKEHFIQFSPASTNVFSKQLECHQKRLPISLTTSHKYWLPICVDKHMGVPDLELTNSELKDVGVAVKKRGKLTEFIETLEMTYSLKALANDPNPVCTVLFSWLKEMKLYPNIRLRLAYHLETITGMDDVANKIRQSIVSSAIYVVDQPQVTALDQVIDLENGNIPKHLGHIADSMSEWEGKIADELMLTPADVEAIKEKHRNKFDLQKREALLLWKLKLGNGATYRKLITVFEGADCKNYADMVRSIIDPERRGKIFNPLEVQQQIEMGGWQSGSQQSQVHQGTRGSGFTTKPQLASYAGQQPQQPLPQLNSRSMDHLQQQLGSLNISGIQHPQNIQSFGTAQQQCAESQWSQTFKGSRVQQLRYQQQIDVAKQHQQQFGQFTSPHQPPQLFNMPQYSQQQQYYTGAHPSQQDLRVHVTTVQQPQSSQQLQTTGVQQHFESFTHDPQQHLHLYATAQPPQQQHFAGPQLPSLQQPFGTLEPQGQFNVAQQPQQIESLFAGYQQNFGSGQQPQQQYAGTHQQNQSIQQTLQPHQHYPANKGEAFNPFASIPSSIQGDTASGISLPNARQPYLKERELHLPQASTGNPFASDKQTGGGAISLDWVAFPDAFLGGTSQQPSTGNQFSIHSTNQGSQSHGVPAGWETFQQDNQPAEWPSFKGEPSQQPHSSSSNPFDCTDPVSGNISFQGQGQPSSQTFIPPEVPQVHQTLSTNPFASDFNNSSTSNHSRTGWSTFEEEDPLKYGGVPQSTPQQDPVTCADPVSSTVSFQGQGQPSSQTFVPPEVPRVHQTLSTHPYASGFISSSTSHHSRTEWTTFEEEEDHLKYGGVP